MCTESAKSATFNVSTQTIETTIATQVQMINDFGFRPEAIYIEAKLYEQLQADQAEKHGLSSGGDFTFKMEKFNGINIVPMVDVRNMNHHTYFKGYGLPIQVTMAPVPVEVTETEETETEATIDFDFDGTLGSLPKALKELAYSNFDPRFYGRTSEATIYPVDSPNFDINKVQLLQAFDWEDSAQGHSFWNDIRIGTNEAISEKERTLKSI